MTTRIPSIDRNVHWQIKANEQNKYTNKYPNPMDKRKTNILLKTNTGAKKKQKNIEYKMKLQKKPQNERNISWRL